MLQVYERLGSVNATPRHSPTPANCSPAHMAHIEATVRRPLPPHEAVVKRYSDPAAASNYAAQFPLAHSHPAYSLYASPSNGAAATAVAPRAASQTPSSCPSPHLLSAASAPSATAYTHQQQSPHIIVSRSPLPSSHTTSLSRAHAQQLQQQQQQQHYGGARASAPRTIETIRFRKSTHDGSLGIRVIGGNHVGIFVSAVQQDSAAAHHGLQVGDRLHEVNERSMIRVTREEAVGRWRRATSGDQIKSVCVFRASSCSRLRCELLLCVHFLLLCVCIIYSIVYLRDSDS